MNTENNNIYPQTETGKKSLVSTDLYRGVWLEYIENGQELPVGGSMFEHTLTTKLLLDPDIIVSDLGIEKIDTGYEKNKDAFDTWFAKVPTTLRNSIDGKMYYTLAMLQTQIHTILRKGTEDMSNQRGQKYANNNIPKLSDFSDGSGACAEIAALGKYALQKLGIYSIYMSGSWLHTSSTSGYSYSTDHSFVILFPDTPRQLIWDIARPIGTEKLPTLYKPDQIVNIDTFVGQHNIFIPLVDITTGDSRESFGVSSYGIDTENGYGAIPNIVRSQVDDILSPK